MWKVAAAATAAGLKANSYWVASWDIGAQEKAAIAADGVDMVFSRYAEKVSGTDMLMRIASMYIAMYVAMLCIVQKENENYIPAKNKEWHISCSLYVYMA